MLTTTPKRGLWALWLLVAVAAGAACTQQPRAVPINPYVDGPYLISQANYLIADLVRTDTITLDRARHLRGVTRRAQEQIELARDAAVDGAAASEQVALAVARTALDELRQFLLTRK